MSGAIFIILFGLNFVTSPCQGTITLPPGGDTIVIASRTARVEIAWTFDDTITLGTVRRWNFVTKNEPLALLVGTGSSVTKLSRLFEFEIEDKATLVLKNVNDSYNGTYEFSIQHAVIPERSRVSVFIAVRPNVTINCSSPIIVNEGKDARCLCKGEGGNPPASVTWYKDGKQIGVAGHEEKWLTINNVNETNNGTYKCVAQSYNLKANTSIDIIVHFKPKVTSLTFSPEVVYIGENVTIECKASGYPAPRYNITLNDKLVSNEMMYELTNLNTSHAGSIITCTATNNLGNDSQSKGLPLKVRPSVTINCSSTITVNESDSVRCLCEGKGGYPPANVTWYDKDNKMIGDVGNEEEKMLTLNNVKETNNGTYKCVAQSYNLPADKSIKVIVHFKPTVTSLTFSPKVVYIGQNVTIECKANGYPAPSYTITITLNDTLVLSNQMMYELTNLDSSHRGSIITCTATNILRSDSQSKGLPLKVRPNVTINCSSTITVNERDSVRCLCEGKGGYPPANVTWYDKDGEMIGDAGDEEKLLTLYNVDETNNGTYKCVAQSYNLLAEESIKIIVHFSPSITPTTKGNKTDIKTHITGDVGLSVGAIVGIVIGVLVLLVFVIVLARWKKNKEKDRHSRNVIVNSSNIDQANLYESVNDGSKAGGDNAGGSTSGNPPASANPSAVYAAVDKNRKNEPSVTYATLDTLAMHTNASEKRDNEPKREPTEYASINFMDMKGGPSVKRQ